MNKEQFKNCAVYTRVSTDIQAEKEFSSCESQEEKIKSFVESQNDWRVFKVYTDAGFTGANTNRPALQELFEDIKRKKIDIILSYKIDRLTRSPKDFYQLVEFFDQYNVDFISITERFDTGTPAGRLLRNIMLTFAQFERELTGERTRDKMLERAKKGFYNGGYAPFGYKREDKKLLISKKDSEVVRLIFETYIETQSLDEVYSLLKKKEIKNRNGKLFYKTAVAFILRNPAYAGKVKHNNIIYQGIHQPIISEELFELAQEAHQKRIRKFRVYRNFLFGGLIDCQECKSKMTSCFTNKTKQGKLKRYFYYRCTATLKRGWESCGTKQVSADRIEKYILENLERISMDKNYIETLVFKLNHSSNAPARAGYEPTDVCSKFSKYSPETVLSVLQSLLSNLSKKKGIERNLLAKKFIKKITYSKENIKIALYYPENRKGSKNEKTPALLSQGGAEKSENKGENYVLDGEYKFVSKMMARGLGRCWNLFKGIIEARII